MKVEWPGSVNKIEFDGVVLYDEFELVMMTCVMNGFTVVVFELVMGLVHQQRWNQYLDLVVDQQGAARAKHQDISDLLSTTMITELHRITRSLP